MLRVGRRLGFVVGASLGGVAGGLLSFAAIGMGSFWLFCAGNFLLGFYRGFAMYYRFAAIEVASPGFRSRAISFVLAGGVLAAFIGPWITSNTKDLIDGALFGGPYLVIGLLALVAVVLMRFLKVPPAGEPQPGEIPRPMKAIVSQPNFMVAVLAGTIGYTVMMLVMTAMPLAMSTHGFSLDQAAFIMQWHVLGMFAPSFVTGSLIARFGVTNILRAGVVMLVGTVVASNMGISLAHFWVALVLLGIGWNFLFVGGSTLLSTIHSEAERGKVQGVNDLAIFSLVTIGSFMAGTMLHRLGWQTLNLAMLPPILLVAIATFWPQLRKRKLPTPPLSAALGEQENVLLD